MRTISARTAAYSRLGAGQHGRGRDVGVPERVAELGREQRLAQLGGPARRSGRPRRRGARPSPRAPPAASSAAARRRGRSAATSGSVAAAASALGDRVPRELRHAADALGGDLGVELRDRPRRVRADDRPGLVQRARDPLEPARHGREPHGERREVAGEQRVQPASDQVDPEQRVPRLLAQLRLGEPERRELAQDQVPVDPLVGGQRRRIEPCQRRLPAIDERERAPRDPPRSCPASGRRSDGRRRRWRRPAGARTAPRGRRRRGRRRRTREPPVRGPASLAPARQAVERPAACLRARTIAQAWPPS